MIIIPLKSVRASTISEKEYMAPRVLSAKGLRERDTIMAAKVIRNPAPTCDALPGYTKTSTEACTSSIASVWLILHNVMQGASHHRDA